MRTLLKSIARNRVARRATRNHLLNTPLRQVSPAIAMIHNIRVPRATEPKPEPTPACAANINIVLQILDSVLQLDGDLAECGVHRGSSLISTGLYLRECASQKRVFGFDSFKGFSDKISADLELSSNPDEDARVDKRVGGFADTSYDAVRSEIELLNLPDRVAVIPGFFENSLSQVEDRQFCYVSIDCDIYSSYKECLEFFYPRLVCGGIILLDEYNDPAWPGCNKAVDEFLAGKPEELEEMEDNNFVKYCLVKQ